MMQVLVLSAGIFTFIRYFKEQDFMRAWKLHGKRRQYGTGRCFLAGALLQRSVAAVLLAFLGGTYTLCQAQAELRTAQGVHSLPAAVAEKQIPVHLHAVVTYYDPYIDPRHGALFAEDASGGIFVAVPASLQAHLGTLTEGDRVDIVGHTAPGDFASTVLADSLQVFGKRQELRRPPKTGVSELLTGTKDCERVRLSGIVQSVTYAAHNVTLQLATADGSIGATAKRSPVSDYAPLIDAEVNIDGVAAPLFNHDRQITGARVFFEGPSQLHVERAAVSDAFRIPLIPIHALSRYSPETGLGHRVHVRGTVTLLWPNNRICVQDATRAVCAQSKETSGIKVGDTADVVGYPSLGEYRPSLIYAISRRYGSSSPLPAARISEQQAVHGDFDAELVQLQGQVIGRNIVAGEVNLLLGTGKSIVPVQLPPGSTAHSLNSIPDGSLVLVTGICGVQVDNGETLLGMGFEIAKSFHLSVRSPEDIVVLKRPSFWTANRILLLLVFVLTLTAFVLAWVYILRRRVDQQTRVIRESEERFKDLAQHDALTRLPTRTVLRERLRSALEQARLSSKQIALLMVDLDDFKSINDTMGHHAGDEALRVTAGKLLAAVRPQDTVARMGGDEFLILVQGLAHEQQAEEIAARILDSFAMHVSLGHQDVLLAVSIGVLRVVDPAVDLDVLLKNVDAAMYAAKNSGRSCFRRFTADMEVASHRTVLIRAHLHRALARNEFELYYQPLLDLRTGLVEGFEALLRWTNPELGPVSPEEFIPVAEESHVIVQLGEWVVDQALCQIAALRARFHHDYFVAVNLSPREFLHEGLVDSIRRSLARHGCAPECLKLEITERTLMSHSPHVQRILHAVRALGVQLAIDDFGVGFSSLSYIAHLPVDWIKVDRSLVSDCVPNPRSAAVLRAIVTMAHSIGIRVVTEGLETEEQFRLVTQEACDVGQGYWICRPVQAAQMAAVILATNQQFAAAMLEAAQLRLPNDGYRAKSYATATQSLLPEVPA